MASPFSEFCGGGFGRQSVVGVADARAGAFRRATIERVSSICQSYLGYCAEYSQTIQSFAFDRFFENLSELSDRDLAIVTRAIQELDNVVAYATE